MKLSKEQIDEFQKMVWEQYEHLGRHDLPWRQPDADGSFDAYKILVSELMLQQTQVGRVIPKFNLFLELFPTVEALAAAPLAAVLVAWSGLGYNRRAKFLHSSAKNIVETFSGGFPRRVDELVMLPGVGKNTAGAIAAYAFNVPAIFVETNIRTVVFYHFLAGREVVSDGEVAELVAQTLETKHPREWYWALMDYGSYLKANGIKLNKLSKHYAKQAKFAGSNRQVRGNVVRALTVQDRSDADLRKLLDDERLDSVLSQLLAEGLITKKANRYHLSD